MRKLMCTLPITLTLAGIFYAGCLEPADAQNPQCPTRPVGDNTNACASTAFVLANSITGPGTTAVGDVAVWNNTTGTVLADNVLGLNIAVPPGSNTFTPVSGAAATMLGRTAGARCAGTAIYTTPGIGPAPSAGQFLLCSDLADSSAGNYSSVYAMAYNTGTRYTAALTGIATHPAGTTGANGWGLQGSVVFQGNAAGIGQGANLEVDYSTGSVNAIAVTLKLGDSAGGTTANPGNSYIFSLADQGKAPTAGWRLRAGTALAPPIDSTGAIILIDGSTYSSAYGLKWDTGTFTTAAIITPGFSVNGSGDVVTKSVAYKDQNGAGSFNTKLRTANTLTANRNLNINAGDADRTLSISLGDVTLPNITASTGTGTTLVLSTSPTFTTSIITPQIYGGTAAGSTLAINGTSSGSPSADKVSFLSGTKNIWGFKQNPAGDVGGTYVECWPGNSASSQNAECDVISSIANAGLSYRMKGTFPWVLHAPSDQSQAALMCIYENEVNGTDRMCWSAAASIASSFTLIWPSALPAQSNTPMVVSTGGTLSFGTSLSYNMVTPPSGLWTVSNNASALPASTFTGGMVEIANSDGVATRANMDVFRNGNVVNASFSFRSANGTAASRTATVNGDVLGGFFFQGAIDSTSYNSNPAAIFGVALETFSSTVSGTSLRFTTITAGTNTAVNSQLHGSGGLSINSTTDPGAGIIMANTGFRAGANSGLSATTTVRASGGAADCTLIFTGGLKTGGTC